MAKRVVEMKEKSAIVSKGYLALGIGCCCKASTGESGVCVLKDCLGKLTLRL